MANVLLESLLGARRDATPPEWLADARQRAVAALERDGLPDARNEAWRYTNLRALGQRSYATVDRDAPPRVFEPAAFDLPGVDGPRLVFIDGIFRADLSSADTQAGLAVQALSRVLADDPDSLQEALGRPFDGSALAFAQFNTVLAEDGAVIRVDAGVKAVQPVHLLHFGTATNSATAVHARIIVELGDDASLMLVEHHLGDAAEANLCNAVTQVNLGARAHLDFVQLQVAGESSTRIRRTEATVGADAMLDLHTVELGAALSRHDLVVHLRGDGSRLRSHGVYALRGRQHSDTRLDVRHVARDTRCELLWRGVADQRSRAVFHGGITVQPGADGADAILSNKNLLLSAQAEIDTQPVLEIHADEVKAAHGATVGQLDEQAVFYLRTRGLSAAQARALLTQAFCRVAIESIASVELREHAGTLLFDRLPGPADTEVSA